MTDERKSFEAWILSITATADLTRGVGGEYIVHRLQSCWQGWQARAMLGVAVLPAGQPVRE